MLTLEQARQIQKHKEKKTIFSFVVLTIICIIVFFLLFRFTSIISISKVFLALPAIAIIAIIHYTKILKFLSPKEFSGKIVRITFFSVRENTVKGAGWYMPSMLQSQDAARIVIKDINGKKAKRTFHKGDIVSKLAEGDEITVLRFIDEQPFPFKPNK